MADFKISRNTTKQELGDVLSANYKVVAKKNKNLGDRIAYASKHEASRADLIGLVKEVISTLGSKLIVPTLAEETPTETPKAEPKKSLKKSEAKVEASLKKSTGKKSEATPKTEPKAKSKKSVEKNEEPSAVETLKDDNPKTKVIQRASKFKDEITVGDDTYVKSSIDSMEALHKAFDENPEANIIFAYYQPKRNLRQFGYQPTIKVQPKSFKDDLDITSVIYVSDEDKIAYAVSTETEAMYIILPEDFEEIDGVKVSGFIEYEIYELAEE